MTCNGSATECGHIRRDAERVRVSRCLDCGVLVVRWLFSVVPALFLLLATAARAGQGAT